MICTQFFLFGSPHQRIFAGVVDTAKKAAASLTAAGESEPSPMLGTEAGKRWQWVFSNKFPPIMALKALAAIGMTAAEAVPPALKYAKNAAKWTKEKVIYGDEAILPIAAERTAAMVYRGTGEMIALPAIQTAFGAAYSLARWGLRLPVNILTAPKNIAQFGIGLLQKGAGGILSIPGILSGTAEKWSQKADTAGAKNIEAGVRNGIIDDTRTSIEIAAGAVKTAALTSVRGGMTAFTPESVTTQIRGGIAAFSQNQDLLGGLVSKDKKQAKKGAQLFYLDDFRDHEKAA